jgi:hypothetical protein
MPGDGAFRLQRVWPSEQLQESLCRMQAVRRVPGLSGHWEKVTSFNLRTGGDMSFYIVFYIVVFAFGLFFWIYEGERRRKGERKSELDHARYEEERSLRQAEWEFDRALLADQFPSETVLSLLQDRSSFTDDDGHHYHPIPENVWNHAPYLRRERTWDDVCSDYSKAVKLVRGEKARIAKIVAEMEAIPDGYQQVANEFGKLVILCSARWEDIYQTAIALHGKFTYDPFPQAAKRDLLKILKSLSVASGSIPEELGRLYQSVSALLEPTTRRSLADCISQIGGSEHNPSVPLIVVESFSDDKTDGARFYQPAAAAYLSFLQQASNCCQSSMAVTAVTKQYRGLLAPFLPSIRRQEPLRSPAPVPVSSAGRGLSAVAGMADLKRQLQDEVVDVFRDPDKYKRYGFSIPNGILLFGPPGCGKTYIARQLAAELGCAFIEVAPSDIGSTYIHGSTLKIREMFDAAALEAPSVLFIDEFEAFVPARAEAEGGRHNYKNEEINEFLTRIDSCSAKGVLLIAATNRPWAIDPAVQRTGRFDKKIYVAPPDIPARGQLLSHYLDGRYGSELLNTEAISAGLSGYSSSDLKLLVDEAARIAFKADQPIGAEHFAGAQNIVRPSILAADESQFQQFRDSAAVASRRVGFRAETQV